jgi:hypothetical protein
MRELAQFGANLFLDHLKDTAASPFALIAYVALIGAWTYLQSRNVRLKRLRDLPPNQRLEALRLEYKTEPRDGLSAEQWIRSRRQTLVLIAFLATLFVVLVIVGIALWAPPQSVNHEISPLNEPVTEVAVPKPVPATIRAASGPVTRSDLSEVSQGLVVEEVLKGAEHPPADDASRTFDITVLNPTDRQIFVKAFDVRWAYYTGWELAIDHGEALRPVEKYILQLSIDTDQPYPKVQTEREPLSPLLVLPPKNESGPSITTFRVQLHYVLDGRLDYHPCSDWDIFVNLNLVDGTGNQTPVLSKFSWRRGRSLDDDQLDLSGTAVPAPR